MQLSTEASQPRYGFKELAKQISEQDKRSENLKIQRLEVLDVTWPKLDLSPIQKVV